MLFAKSIEFGLPREEGSDDQWEGAMPPNAPLGYGPGNVLGIGFIEHCLDICIGLQCLF